MNIRKADETGVHNRTQQKAVKGKGLLQQKGTEKEQSLYQVAAWLRPELSAFIASRALVVA